VEKLERIVAGITNGEPLSKAWRPLYCMERNVTGDDVISYTAAENKTLRKCAECGRQGDVLRCARCQNVFFCGRACQSKAWKTHKTTCCKLKFPKARAKVAGH
jgi:hypothetical protein